MHPLITYMPKQMLLEAHEAFEQIAGGKTPPEPHNEARLYRFEKFSVRLPQGADPDENQG